MTGPRVGPDGSPTDDAEFFDTTAKAHKDLMSKKVDAKKAFEDAFAEDEEMRDGINRIVQELEGKAPPKKKDTAPKPKPEKEENAATRREAALKKAAAEKLEATAKADAAAWLHRQVNVKTPKEPPPKPSKPSTAVPSSSPLISKSPEVAPKSGVASSKPSKLPKEGTKIPHPSPEKDVVHRAWSEAVDGAAAVAPPGDLLQSGASSESVPTGTETLGVMRRLRLPVRPPEVNDGQAMPTLPKSAPTKETAPTKKKQIAAPEFYQLLDISVDATFEEIKKAYRQQALKWHPDKNRGQPEKATEMFKRINAAFDTLFDPEKKKAYDSGQVVTQSKAKKLQGHGWSNAADEDDSSLTPLGFKLKKQSWNGYIYFGGRWDDVDPVTDFENDPRAPQEKIKVFWRYIGEKAYDARETGNFGAGERASDQCSVGRNWAKSFVESVWGGTPSHWPGAQELQGMNETSQQEWQERRMIYNRRKQKVLLHLDLHDQYLALPDRRKKEKEALRKIWGDRIKD